MGRPQLVLGLALTLGMLGLATPAFAQDPTGLCKAGRSDRAERPAPDALLPRLGKTFGVDPGVLRGTSYIRCMEGRLVACEVGANLDCGPAKVSRHSAGGDAFCHDNPGAAVVPMAATGHDTVYDWHCRGTRAVAGRQFEAVDRLGFMSGNWRPVR